MGNRHEGAPVLVGVVAGSAAVGTAKLEFDPDEVPSHPSLSVVVPAYRNGSRIRANIDRLTAALDDTGLGWEVIVVVDGDDYTFRHATPAPSTKVPLLRYQTNRTKGFPLPY